MINKKIGRLRLEVYASIEELPADRYNKFNTYCMLAVGVGGDPESLDKHITDIYTSLQKKDTERLIVQFQNYHHCLNLMLEQVDTQSIAFACLIHSINGQVINDMSDDNLRSISKRITKNVKRSIGLEMLRELKKKLRMK